MNPGCNATAITVGDDLIKIFNEHLHSDDMEKIIHSQLKDSMKIMVSKDPYRSSQDIYDCAKLELVRSFGSVRDIAEFLPSFASLKSSIHRWKGGVSPSGFVMSRDTFRSIFFEMDNNRTLLMHASFDNEKMIILGDHAYIKRFTEMRSFSIIMDGTFKSSSTSFYQIYIIHGCFSGQSFPLIYCFLDSKTETTYTRMLAIIKDVLLEKGVTFSPHKVQIDFERAMFNALRAEFSNVQISGCYFHFGQAIWRRVQNLGLVSLYKSDDNFQRCIHLTSSLPLVPLVEVDTAWAYIQSCWPTNHEQTLELKEYIYRTWISVSDGSLFDRVVWNQFGVVRGRTNNVAEGFHSALNKKINKTATSFWEVGSLLKKIHSYADVELRRLVGGGTPKPRKRVYIRQDEKILLLWNLYDRRCISLIELMDGLKSAIKLELQ